MNRQLSARYLVLLGPQEAPRALLFNGQYDYLAEMQMDDDDGMTIDHLIQSSRRCPPPHALDFDALVDPRLAARGQGVRCFALGG